MDLLKHTPFPQASVCLFFFFQMVFFFPVTERLFCFLGFHVGKLYQATVDPSWLLLWTGQLMVEGGLQVS